MIEHYQAEIRRKLNQQWRMERKSIVTIKSYNYALKILLDRLPVYFDEYNTDDLVAYCETFNGINQRDLQITMIRAVYRIMHGMDLYWKLFPYIKRKKRIQPRFNTQEVQALINATDNIGHKLIMLTQFATGLRVSEVVFLKRKDLFREAGFIYVDGEGINNDRFAPLPDNIFRMLDDFSKDKKDNAYIWPGQYGGHLSTRSVQQIINQCKAKAGISHTANSHGLRRGYATESVRGGAHMLAIRDILGHSDVRTTQIYTGTSHDFLKEQFNPAAELKVA